MATSRKDDYRQPNSSFLFGLIIGAVIGAVIAIIIYKNNKSEVLQDFQKKIQEIFNNFLSPDEMSKKSSTNKSAPKPKFEIEFVEPKSTSDTKKKTPPKMFVKSRK